MPIRHRVRTSTVMLSVVFLLPLTTYLLVRPAPKPAPTIVGVVTTPA